MKYNQYIDFKNFINTSIEKDDTITIKKIIYESSIKDFQKSLKIKNSEINIENNLNQKLNEFEYIELKKKQSFINI